MPVPNFTEISKAEGAALSEKIENSEQKRPDFDATLRTALITIQNRAFEPPRLRHRSES
ncbi:hypothetical protein EV286_11686 [Rhizobium sp. BK251]|nr:hypothetical protein EV286_11686 [Rhizobium sp. BK251]